MADAGDGKKFGSCRDELHCRGQLVDGTEAVPHAVNKECRGVEAGKMRSPQLGAPLRWMERVGEEQERICNFRFSRAEHRRLPSSVGMAAQKKLACRLPPHGRDGRSKALLIAFRTATRRWTMRTQLAEGKIAAEDRHSHGAECIRQRDEKRGVTVRSCAVCQDEAVAAGSRRAMQIATNGYAMRIVAKFFGVGHTNTVVQPDGRTLC